MNTERYAELIAELAAMLSEEYEIDTAEEIVKTDLGIAMEELAAAV
jgi:hypothetical protein